MSNPSSRSKGTKNKGQKVIDSQGWTHVVRGPKHGHAHQRLVTALDDLSISSSPDTVDLQKALQRYHKIWTSSPACEKLLTFLKADVIPAAEITIHKCICLGLGSLSDGRESSRFQYATLSSILRFLNQQSRLGQVIFQDPAFTRSDREYLESQGHTVVTSPAAFDLVDANTFLFAPHLEHEYYAKAVQNHLPAITIGSDIDPLLQRTFIPTHHQEGNTDTHNIFQHFSAKTKRHPMPKFEQDPWCLFTSLYWRSDSAVAGDLPNEPDGS